MSHDKIDDAMAINYESDLAHWKKRAIDAESALAAQQEPTGYFYEWDCHGGIHREFNAGLLNGMKPDRVVAYYSAPLSGVRAGMLRDDWLDERDVKTAYEYMRECNFPDMAACRVVEAAYRHITRAADPVNAEEKS